MRRTLVLLAVSVITLLAMADDSIHVSWTMHEPIGGTPIGSTVAQLVEIEVEVISLSSPATVWLSGSQSLYFSTTATSIPAGTNAKHTLYLSYTPMRAGVHKVNVNIEGPVPVYESKSFSALAYDPANPPTTSVNHSGVLDFEAGAGETDQAFFTVTSANLLDYNGKVTITAQSTPGTFVLNNTTLFQNGTSTHTITFRPQAVGTYTATVEISATLTDTLRFDIYGVCTVPPVPGQKEGDELPLVTDNARTTYTTDFSGVTRHRPISMEGWKNLAMTGTRAWWGYDYDGDGCARVTAYDSQATESSDCQMLLVSPALDFEHCESPLVTFRLRGDILYDDMPELLEVCYIDIAEGDMYIQPLEMDIPHSADAKGEWHDYIIDLSGQEVADIFFIGFRYTAMRGRESSASYSIDDFSWGTPASGVAPTMAPKTKAAPVKRMEHGHLLISVGEHTYDARGILIRK